MVDIISNMVNKLIVPEYKSSDGNDLIYTVSPNSDMYENYLIRYSFDNNDLDLTEEDKLIEETKAIFSMIGFHHINHYYIKRNGGKKYIDIICFCDEWCAKKDEDLLLN